jgi:RHS repeat-associated protein
VGQPTVQLLTDKALRVDWAYQDNAHDRRLLGITHNGTGGAPDQSYVSIAETGIVQRTDTPSEVTQNYQYDPEDRLTQITRSVPPGKDCPVTPARTVGGAAETLSYDNLGRLTSESNPLGSFSYAYLGQTGQPTVQLLTGHALRVDWAYQDNAHDRRLLSITHNGAGGAADQSYVSIAETGIVQRRDTPSDVVQDYQFDAEDRLTQITRSVPPGKDCPVTPNNPNRPPDATYAKDCGIHNGKNTSDTSFNAAQVGIEAVQTSVPSSAISLDLSAASTAVENLHSTTNDGIDTAGNSLPSPPPASGPSTLNVTYQTYTQDDADNLTGIGEASYAYSASVNTDNQITSTTLNAQTQTYTRDANGNITDDRKHFYRWDAENRLIQVTVKSGGQVSQFLYDGLSRRVRHIEQATTTTEARFLWCGEQLCQQRDSADAVTARYYAQGEQHLGAITQSLYYAQDHLGSVIATTDAAGNILGTAEYTAYGRTLSQSGTQADFGYAQMYRHAATGLYLTHYRPYDPDTGRWLARDPIGEKGGVNLYAYTNNNPIGYVDPLGLETTMVCRSVSDRLAGLFGSKHCSVVVWHYEREPSFGPKARAIDYQFSLAGDTKAQAQGSQKETSSLDRWTFTLGVGGEYPISPVPFTHEVFDQAIAREGRYYDSVEDYSAKFGPNSNTGADNVIERAGGVAPDVPRAYWQDYGE